MKKNVPYFTLKGRLNRKRFLKRYLITVVCIFLLVLIITIFDTSLDFSPRGMKPIVEKARIEGIVFVLYTVLLQLKRLQDLNAAKIVMAASVFCAAKPYLYFWLHIPNNVLTSLTYMALGLAFFIPLLFFKGTAGPNRYGEDPLMDEDAAAVNPVEDVPAAAETDVKLPLWQKIIRALFVLYIIELLINIF